MLALSVYVQLQTALFHAADRFDDLRRTRDDRGQATAEYALVLLGAAGVALLVVAWAKDSNRIEKLLNRVFDQVIGRVR